MFQTPYTAHQQYMAAQAEARAAQARAKAAEAQYLAQQAILREEAALKARLYELDQRKRHVVPGFVPDAVTYSPYAIPTYQNDILLFETPYSSSPFHTTPGLNPTPYSRLPSTSTPICLYQPYSHCDLFERERRKQELFERPIRQEQEICLEAERERIRREREALELIRKEQEARLAAERERIDKQKEATLARLAVKQEPERKKQESKATKAASRQYVEYYVCDPCTVAYAQGLRLPCPHRAVQYTPVQTTKPSPPAPQPAQLKSAIFDNEEELIKLFSAIFGTAATPTTTDVIGCPSPQLQQERAHTAVKPKAQTLNAEPKRSQTSGDSLVDQLKSRYQIDDDDEIKDTILAVIDSLSKKAPQATAVTKPAAIPAKKRPVEGSLVEQLQTRSKSESDQEVRDTIQATIHSLLNSPPSPPPPPSTSRSNGQTNVDASTPSTPTVESRLNEIDRIRDTFRKFESEFIFPSQLDFIPAPKPATTALANLVYTARNHPVRFYEQCLAKLLAELDSIESNGDATLRSKRKEAVHLVEQALETLEEEIMGRWKTAKEQTTASSSDAVESETPSFNLPVTSDESGNKIGAEGLEAAEESEAPETDSEVEAKDSTVVPFGVDELAFHEKGTENARLEPKALTEISPKDVQDSIPSESQLDTTSDEDATSSGGPGKDEPEAPAPEVVDSSSTPPLTTIATSDVASDGSSNGFTEENYVQDASCFLLTQTEEEQLKRKAKKGKVADLGSDWSELDG